jgi:hypothetical protein
MHSLRKQTIRERISTLKKELEGAQWAADAARLQRILDVREQQLERLKFWARSIEEKIPGGCPEAKPIPHSAFAMICFDAASRLAHGDVAKRLREIGSTFAAKAYEARAGNKEPHPAAPGPARREPTHYAEPVSSPATLSR